MDVTPSGSSLGADIILYDNKKYKIDFENIDGKRGILIQDNVSFISRDEIPQDILIDNTILLIFDVGSSMITIHDEITKNSPTEINMIKTDVDYALKNVNEILNNIKQIQKAVYRKNGPRIFYYFNASIFIRNITYANSM